MFTVAHLVDSFLNHYRVLVSAEQCAKATWTFYFFQLKKLVAAAGLMPADALRTHHLTAVKFTNHFVRAIKALYRWAGDEELVPKDPFKKITVPKCGERERILKPAEMLRLYRACSRPFRLFLFSLRYTIARPGELRKLQWSQVDLAARVLRLKEFKGKKKRRDGLKERVIPIGVPAFILLRCWHARRSPKPTDPVFPAKHGGVRSANSLRCLMRAARERAGLDDQGDEEERIVVYTMRHTGATNAIMNGVPQMVLAKMMGHSKITTTARYVHAQEDDLIDGIDRATKKRKRRDHDS